MTKDELMKYDKEVLAEVLAYSSGWSIIRKERLDSIQKNIKAIRRSERRSKILERQSVIWEELRKLNPVRQHKKFQVLFAESEKLDQEFTRLLNF